MIVGIIGLIGSGKSTVARQLVNEYGFRSDSFATSLKDAVSSMFAWPRNLLEGDTAESRKWREEIDPWWSEKLNISNFNPRLALQLIGTDALRSGFNEDIWFLTLQNRVRKDPDKHVVISDVRFPNEIEFIRENGGKLIQVNRGPLPVWHETAILANRGNSIAREVMLKTFPSIHFSEWARAGVSVDFELSNDSTIENLNMQVRDIMGSIL